VKLSIDTTAQTIVVQEAEGARELPLHSTEGLSLVSRLWAKVAWNQKHSYGFTWMGRPIIQLPEDMVRVQEVVHRTRPDVLIETGVAHGGSLVFYASLFKAMSRGRVIGVDIDIRAHNRKALEQHALAPLITLVEGSSTSAETLERVRGLVAPGERVMVVLDSNHSKAHVSRELALYAPLVTAGCYLVATDGFMEELHDVPRGQPGWRHDNPAAAAREFARDNPEFVLERPPFLFDETLSRVEVTHWPDAYLRRR
jgi:cephalosporin hydroxylase